MTDNKNVKKQFTVEQDYDFQGDSLLFNITQKYRYQKSVQIKDNIIIDFDENDVPVALELLNASKLLHVNKSSLTYPMGIDMFIEVGQEMIKLQAKFLISIHQKQTPMSLNEQTSNDINLRVTESHFATA